MEESSYAPSLWVLVVGQVLLAILIFYSQDCIKHFQSFTKSFKSLRDEGKARYFKEYYALAFGLTVILFGVICTISWLMVNGVEFDPTVGCTDAGRKETSIIALWIYTNFMIAGMSLPSVYIDFLLESNKNVQNTRQIII